MNLEKMTKKELIQYCEELQKVASHNKDQAERAIAVAESYQAVCEKEGLVETDTQTLTEH